MGDMRLPGPAHRNGVVMLVAHKIADGLIAGDMVRVMPGVAAHPEVDMVARDCAQGQEGMVGHRHPGLHRQQGKPRADHARVSREGAPVKRCDDGRDCPTPHRDRGPAATLCEQNGLCQRVDFNKLPLLVAMMPWPEYFQRKVRRRADQA